MAEMIEDIPRKEFEDKLKKYAKHKKPLTGNREGLYVACDCNALEKKANIKKKNIIKIKPNQETVFNFTVGNDMNDESLEFVHVELLHPQRQFSLGKWSRKLLEPKMRHGPLSVTFSGADAGQYEMPIAFKFRRGERTLVMLREMVVHVSGMKHSIIKPVTAFKGDKWDDSKTFVPSLDPPPHYNFKFTKFLKFAFANHLDLSTLNQVASDPDYQKYKETMERVKKVFDVALKDTNNYVPFYQYLLFEEEFVARTMLRQYNMSKVQIKKRGNCYELEVPGLAEKRPSLLKGDRLFIQPLDAGKDITFEGVIKSTEDCTILIDDIHNSFEQYENMICNIKFIMSRYTYEMMHAAVERVITSGHENRIFPQLVTMDVPVEKITRFYNPFIESNEEQRAAVEHIVAKSSGTTPYLVFGPPGTGKTMTIVEAILQVVATKKGCRVMVCTDSNMAADHIALQLIRFGEKLGLDHLLIRANSRTRAWDTMPTELANYSNGSCAANCYSMDNEQLSSYRIVVTTLMHAAKYGTNFIQKKHKLSMTHLFIDEAAQALEPAALIPITGMLAKNGQLVLAGDPKQLGPICMSREASDKMLGTSLMERLYNTRKDVYGQHKYRYITMLVNNFRSDADILSIPNELFYNNELKVKAKYDGLSGTNILGESEGGERAIVFHSVNSKEQRLGKSPSFYNEKELELVVRYITKLVNVHNVRPDDIGVITPYMRQVHKVKAWLQSSNMTNLEVGTVESFQGKEKRVIIISLVRANCKLLDQDKKYRLGFVADPKRFNVALTRAKAKLIVIGNRACLKKDTLWYSYMRKCMELNTYMGEEHEQMERSIELMGDVLRRLNVTGVKDAIDKASRKEQNAERAA